MPFNACLDDVADIAALRSKTFAHFAPQYYTAKEVRTLLEDLDQNHLQDMIENRKIFVIKDKEKIIGSAGWEEDSIRHVYVDPEFTRQGIGSRLLQYAEQDYIARSTKNEIYAGVAVYARPFYEANGYILVSEEKDWDDSKYFKMKKSL